MTSTLLHIAAHHLAVHVAATGLGAAAATVTITAVATPWAIRETRRLLRPRHSGGPVVVSVVRGSLLGISAHHGGGEWSCTF